MNHTSKSATQAVRPAPAELDGWRKYAYLFPPAGYLLLKRALYLLAFGLLAGPLIGYTIRFLSRRPIADVVAGETPARTLLFYMLFGVLMSMSCYITCALPAKYLQSVLGHSPKTVFVPLRLLTLLAGTLLGLVFSSYVMWWTLSVHIIAEENMRAGLALSAVLGCVLTLVISAFSKLRAEVRQAERMLYESKLQEQILAERTATAQLRALQAQINPHFFFNTLSSITSLLSINTTAAREMLMALAEMYRYMLRCTNTRLVSLEEEMEFVKSYLSIEEVRFRNRLKLDIRCPDNLSQLRLPGLALQPIVENAIKHGIAKNIGSGCIRIRVVQSEADFAISVSNTAEQPPDRPLDRWLIDGHALKNVDDRCSVTYGGEHDMQIGYDGYEICVTLQIPIVA
ncbi:MAG: two-component system, LytTR family, sensor histidine kinase AlgZ [Blastocatellia bacterium]